MALIHFQLRKLEQTGRKCRKLRALLAQFRVSARGGVAAAGPEFGPGEIPLGQRTPRLRGIVRPTAELLARGLALGAIKLVELFEDCRQCRVRRSEERRVGEECKARVSGWEERKVKMGTH